MSSFYPERVRWRQEPNKPYPGKKNAKPHPSFRTEQADFFFRIRSCECVGLRRETSSPSRAFCGMKSLFTSRTALGINLSPQVVDYFKGLASETGLLYQKLFDLYLLDCAKKRKKLTMKWVA